MKVPDPLLRAPLRGAALVSRASQPFVGQPTGFVHLRGDFRMHVPPARHMPATDYPIAPEEKSAALSGIRGERSADPVPIERYRASKKSREGYRNRWIKVFDCK